MILVNPAPSPVSFRQKDAILLFSLTFLRSTRRRQPTHLWVWVWYMPPPLLKPPYFSRVENTGIHVVLFFKKKRSALFFGLITFQPFLSPWISNCLSKIFVDGVCSLGGGEQKSKTFFFCFCRQRFIWRRNCWPSKPKKISFMFTCRSKNCESWCCSCSCYPVCLSSHVKTFVFGSRKHPVNYPPDPRILSISQVFERSLFLFFFRSPIGWRLWVFCDASA